MELSKELDPYTAASFSTQVNAHKSPYYKALSHTDNVDNFGEATFLVRDLLNIVNLSQQRIISELRTSIKDVKHALYTVIKYYSSGSSSLIMIILFQQRYFGDFDVRFGSWISRRELIKMLKGKFSGRKVKAALIRLAKMKLIKVIKRRPLCYMISNKGMRILD